MMMYRRRNVSNIDVAAATALLVGLLCLLLGVSDVTDAQLLSPCPGVFKYVNAEPANGLWVGEIDVSTDDELQGVWIHVVLDKKANLLLNWFGESSTMDNVQYAIRRPDYKLLPGPRLVVKIQVNYNMADTPPQVRAVRLNGRSICAVDKKVRTTEAPKPFISHHFEETSAVTEDDGLTPSYNFGHHNIRTQSTTSNTGHFIERTTERATTRRQQQQQQHQQRVTTTNNYQRPSTQQPTQHQRTTPSISFHDGLDDEVFITSTSAPSVLYTSHATSKSTDSRAGPGIGFSTRTTSYRPTTRATTAPPLIETDGSGEFFAGDFSVAQQMKKRGQQQQQNNRRPQSPSGGGAREEKCGVAVPKAIGLITKAKNAQQGAWPWHVGLFVPDGFTSKYICGGTLITKRHVVTAAHCVTRPGTNSASDAEGLLLQLGRTNLRRFGRESQDRRVDRIIVHPGYDKTNYHNDVALLVMHAPIDYTDFVRPICRWDAQAGDNSIVNKLGTVVGWGYNETHQITDQLQETKMPVVDTLSCIYSNPEFYVRVINGNYTFCAGFLNGTSVCNGDSGSGVFFKRADPFDTQHEHWELRGIVSVGQPLQNSNVCDPFVYTVFVDLLLYGTWITNNIYDE